MASPAGGAPEGRDPAGSWLSRFLPWGGKAQTGRGKEGLNGREGPAESAAWSPPRPALPILSRFPQSRLDL